MTTTGPIDEQAALITDPLKTDFLYSLSAAGVDQYITKENLVKIINVLTELTLPVGADRIAIIDDTAGSVLPRMIALSNLLKFVASQTQETAPDFDADGIPIIKDIGGTPTVEWSYLQDAQVDIGARVYHDAGQTISTGTQTALSFNQERYDTDAFHDTSTNNSRMTIPSGMGGKYLLTAHARWEAVASATERQLSFKVNDTDFIAFQRLFSPAGLASALVSISTAYELSAADYVEVVSFQASGGDLDVESAAKFTPEFSIQKVG